MGNVEMSNRQKQRKGTKSRSLALVFVSVSSSVPFVHCTGPVKPANGVHMVSGCIFSSYGLFLYRCFPNLLKK